MISKSVNKFGDVLFDYGNSSWLASIGKGATTYLGIYQMVDLLISIFVNPFGGVLSDRMKRRRLLMISDFCSALFCFGISFISKDSWMVIALIVVNILLALSGSLSSPAYRSYVPEVVTKEDVLIYNSRLETVVQIIKVSSPVIGLFIFSRIGIRLTLLIDSLTFFLSFICLFLIKEELSTDVETDIKWSERMTFSFLFKEMVEGLVYIRQQKEIFFLLVLAVFVNFFIAMYNYLLPFTPVLFHDRSTFANLLSFGALGSIIGGLLASYVKNSLKGLLNLLILGSFGYLFLAIPLFFTLPSWVCYFGNLYFYCYVQLSFTFYASAFS